MKNILLKIIYSGILRWFLKIFVGVKLPVANDLKELDKFIIVANHNSHLDTMTLMASIPSSVLPRVKPVAAMDHFGKTKFSTWLSNTFINTLLINRRRFKDEPSKDPIHNMISALDHGYSLILFPEGTRGEPEVEQKLKPGIALILKERPNVKVIPAYMKGMGKAMPKGDNLIVPFNSTLKYGEPINLSDYSIEGILNQIQDSFDVLRDTH